MIRPTLDYSDRDYDALFARLDQLTTVAWPNWTDKQRANFGNILIQAFAFVGDVLNKYQDNQALETRWTTAKLRKNLIALASLIQFQPEGVTAAKAEEVFSLEVPAAGDVFLPAGSQVSTREVTAPIRYQLLEDLTILAGNTEVSATVENSEFASDTFVSTGAPNQSFTLSRSPVIDGSVTVTAADGDYVKVDSLLDSTASSRHFVVSLDSTGRQRVTFGNGVNGAIPVGTATAPYRVGGGSAGRVDAGTLRRLLGTFTDSLGNQVTINVNNPLAAQGGSDAQSAESIRSEAPRAARVNKRSIAREDFEIVAEQVPGVARALHLARAEDPTIQINQGLMYIVPQGSGTAGAELLEAVHDAFIEYPYWSSYDLQLFSALYQPVNVTARVWPSNQVTLEVMRANIVAGLTEFFRASDDENVKNERIDFGWYMNRRGVGGALVPWSDVQNVVRDAIGVAKVGAGQGDFMLNSQRADVTLGIRHFPKLGTITVINGLTGEVI